MGWAEGIEAACRKSGRSMASECEARIIRSFDADSLVEWVKQELG